MFLRDLLQPWHLLIILGIVLLIVGPSKLTGLGGALGSSIRDFKRATKDEDEEAEKKAAPIKSVADDDIVLDSPAKQLAAKSVVEDAPLSARRSVAVDDDDDLVAVPAGASSSSVINETGTTIKVGTTRKAYSARR